MALLLLCNGLYGLCSMASFVDRLLDQLLSVLQVLFLLLFIQGQQLLALRFVVLRLYPVPSQHSVLRGDGLLPGQLHFYHAALHTALFFYLILLLNRALPLVEVGSIVQLSLIPLQLCVLLRLLLPEQSILSENCSSVVLYYGLLSWWSVFLRRCRFESTLCHLLRFNSLCELVPFVWVPPSCGLQMHLTESCVLLPDLSLLLLQAFFLVFLNFSKASPVDHGWHWLRLDLAIDNLRLWDKTWLRLSDLEGIRRGELLFLRCLPLGHGDGSCCF
mmetsp:Transcript_25167/g.57851  ORF Transcript_25167/g.57851 Transcript_25167/m.57851 type:complete len:274 (-) Transcript_25167:729-1550(-)